jgi:hypothetical protein
MIEAARNIEIADDKQKSGSATQTQSTIFQKTLKRVVFCVSLSRSLGRQCEICIEETFPGRRGCDSLLLRFNVRSKRLRAFQMINAKKKAPRILMCLRKGGDLLW